MSNDTRPWERIFPHRDHDHLRCVTDAMSDAVRLCRTRGVRLTALRTRVLEIVWQNHKPMGAYDILAVLAAEGRSAAPPTVYRALEFLLEQGLVHRLSSLNAVVGCSRPGHTGCGQFLICRSCGNAAELNDSAVERAITRSATSQGFAVQGHTVEISGVCPDCR
jgi:Fur family zinc uptake transcriptional regulator